MVERIPDSGLDRLTLSLHTLDPDQYHEIYGFGSVDTLRRKVDALLSARERSGMATPIFDIAFVAMNRNLAQLDEVAAYASQLGAGISIHPVIRRDPITETFESELENGVLRPDFLNRLRQAVDSVQGAYPDLPVTVSTPEIGDVTPVRPADRLPRQTTTRRPHPFVRTEPLGDNPHPRRRNGGHV
jgi:molybdenum cofactor biosynthesis enzyme MoaA